MLTETTTTHVGRDEPDVVQLFDALFRHATDCILFTRTDGTVLRANPAACMALGRTEEEIRREGRGGLVVPDASASRLVAERARTGVVVGELTFRRADGGTFPGQVTSTVIATRGGEQCAYVLFRDLTEQRRIEAAVHEREVRLHAYFDTPAVGIAITGPDKRWVEVNNQLCSMLGYSREELLQRTWLDLTHPDDVSPNLSEFDRLVAGETDRYSLDKRFVRKDGTTIWVLVSVSCVRRPDRRVDYLVSIYNDIGRRKHAEEALRNETSLLAAVLGASPAGFAILRGREFRFELVNPAYQSFAPDRRFLGHTVAEVWPDLADQVVPLLRRVVDTNEPFSAEDMRFEIVRRAGSSPEEMYCTFAYQTLPGAGPEPRILVTVVDTTAWKKAEAERLALQKQLALTSRLAAMGTLVAGVAHEINNPLAAVISSAGTAREDVQELQTILRAGGSPDRARLARRAAEVRDMLDDVTSSSARIASIVKDLSIFGRHDQPRAPIRLAETIQKSLAWLPPFVAERAVIRVEAEEVPEAVATEGQIEQVIVNLLGNAALAIPGGRKGEILIRVHPGTPGMVGIEVSDDGRGIAPEMMERIFEPFFTTRPLGQGTGLGLSICNAIVTAHGGTITARSDVGKGSTFRVELPAAPAGE